MKTTRNLLTTIFLLLAAYFSFNGITYEKAIFNNSMSVCCNNLSGTYTSGQQCSGISTVRFYDNPDGPEDLITIGECLRYICNMENGGVAIFDYNSGPPEKYCIASNGSKYYGGCNPPPPPFSVTISGPTTLYIPPKGTGSRTAYFSVNASGGETPYTYSWSFAGQSGSGTSFSYTYYYTTPHSRTLTWTVNSNDGQTITKTKTVDFEHEPEH